MIVTPRPHQPRPYDLAINPQPNDGPTSMEWVYDFAAITGDHHMYWEERRAALGDMVNIAGQRVASDISRSFGEGLTDVKKLAFMEQFAAYPSEMRELVLRMAGLDEAPDPLSARRQILGTLAVSRFITCILVPERLFPGRYDKNVTTGDAIGALVAPDIMLDMDTDENGVPLDYRIHLPLSVATDPTVFPDAGTLDAWYLGRRDGSDVEVRRQDSDKPQDDPLRARDPSRGNLWMHRTEADLSDGLTLYLQQRGIAPRADIATIFPYIPDQSRIPTLGGI